MKQRYRTILYFFFTNTPMKYIDRINLFLSSNNSENNSDSIVDAKNELIRQVLTLLFAVFCCYLLFLIIVTHYHPDTKELIKLAVKLLKPGEINPEPVENLLFTFGMACFPLAALFFYYRLRALSFSEEEVDSVFVSVAIFSCLTLLSLIWMTLGAPPQYLSTAQYPTLFSFYFGHSIAAENVFVYCILVFTIYIFLLFSHKFSLVSNKITRIICLGFLYLFALTAIIRIAQSIVVDFPRRPPNQHIDAVLYSISQVFAGSPMFMHGFTNTYGLYPHFLEPIFRIIGLSYQSFSLVMALMISLSFIFIFLFLWGIIQNRLILFIGFTSYLWMGYIFGKAISHDYYFQYFPLRTIFPSSLLFLSALYLKYSSKIVYFGSFILYSVAILWNPDSGIVVFGAWFLLLLYLELRKKDLFQLIKGITYHAVIALFLLIMTFSLYALYIKFRYGSYPNLLTMVESIGIFRKLGYMMLSMPLKHPWYLYLFICLIGILIPIAGFFQRRIDNKNALILLTSLVSVGAFAYYQGRSHTYTFLNIVGYMFILMTIFADRLLMHINSIKKHDSYRIFLKMLLLVLVFSLTYSLPSVFKFQSRMSPVHDIFPKGPHKTNPFTNDTVFIKKYTSPGEKVLIYSLCCQSIYHIESNTVSAFNPGFVDLFFNNDIDRLKKGLQTSIQKVFIANEPDHYQVISALTPEIKQNFVFVDSNRNLKYYLKAKRKK
jgi:hypothetical protein